ncbi:hypothetical protein CPB85DRAFT_1329404 [Mucidula mucida]|nr:hypothetical protein CPB85DRAFT_1329404 [Mucidula mucida]
MINASSCKLAPDNAESNIPQTPCDPKSVASKRASSCRDNVISRRFESGGTAARLARYQSKKSLGSRRVKLCQTPNSIVTLSTSPCPNRVLGKHCDVFQAQITELISADDIVDPSHGCGGYHF